ncbi:chaperonin 10-like protein [Mycena floridula]|nr:chaperonin 10-like protein [Mycena floridula]
MNALVTAPGNTAIVAQVPIPEPGANEIRVKVHSVALNPVDALYAIHPVGNLGRVIGSDIAGTVDALGPGVTEWIIGDRVAGFLQGASATTPRPGGFATYAILEADLAFRIPNSVSFDQAATMPALFIRLELNSPFADSPFNFPPREGIKLLIYSASTSVGMFTVELAKLLDCKIYATASTRSHQKLLAMGVDAVFDYNSPMQVAGISQTFGPDGGKIAVMRKSAWNKEGLRQDVTPSFGTAWSGLGHEIFYMGSVLEVSPSWRAFTVAFSQWLGKDNDSLPIAPNLVRLMPGGLESIVVDGFKLLGAGKVGDRSSHQETETKPWMRPISGEKLVYRL